MSSSLFRSVVLLAGASLGLEAQVASPGLLPEWETKQMLTGFIGGFERLKPLLEQVKPQNWQNVPNRDIYERQLSSAQDGLKYLGRNVESLIHRPDALPLALESFLRMQGLESSVLMVCDGVRRYQNPALADLLENVLAANTANKEKLKQYLMDLATAREEEFRLVDREAQRCRSLLASPPVRKEVKK